MWNCDDITDVSHPGLLSSGQEINSIVAKHLFKYIYTACIAIHIINCNFIVLREDQ